MTKRFCDTELWHKDWFLRLSVELRMLYMYLKDNCDCAGIYELNTMLASFILGHDVTIDDFLKLNEHKKIIEVIDDNHLYLCDFVLFQQGIESLDELNPRNNAHKGIMRRLKKYGIIDVDSKVLERTPRKADKVTPINSKNKKDENKDIYISKEIDEVFKIYKEKCPNLCKLTFEKRNMDLRRKIEDFLFEIKSDMNYFKELCEKANKTKYIADCKIDLKSLINNHIGIMNGKYEPPVDEAEEALKRFMENY